MSLRIIHVLSNIEKVNFGIWNAALFAHKYLAAYDVETIALVCTNETALPPGFPSIPVHFLGTNNLKDSIREFIRKMNGDPSKDILVTHGCWLASSKAGYVFSECNFKWIYLPHGMLEPWSMQLGRWKKIIYYYLFERQYAMRATRVRAVSIVEQKNLTATLQRPIDLITNGVPQQPITPKQSNIINFLFLGRLHFKKGILPLVKAWKKELGDLPLKRLIIAGPDEGELKEVRPFMSGNVSYIGPVYGEEKAQLLSRSHYFLLPSFSEGFPVSALEAMSYGLIPLISKGCNFDEIFNQRLGYRIEPDEEQIAGVLRQLRSIDFDNDLSRRNQEFIKERFSEEVIGDQLIKFYNSILNP